MSSDLRDRLEDLAAHTSAGSPPPDLWDRGVRRRRLDRAVSAGVVVVLVLLLGAGGFAWRSDRSRIAPADTHGSPHLPDRFWVPSPWLHAFDGPPGQLVAIGTGTRKSLFHTTERVYGVTASAGQYGFLDLPPDAVTKLLSETSAPVLSPDGGQIAFWTVGEPTGSPNTKLVGVTVAGVGVYDTTTGRVSRVALPTQHGLEPSTLQWLDGDTLLIGISQASYGDSNEESCCSGHWQGLATWQVGDPEGATLLPRSLPLFIEDRQTSTARGRIVFSQGGHELHEIDPRPPVTDRTFRLPNTTDYAVLSPDLRRLAYVVGSNPSPGHFQVARIPSGPVRAQARTVAAHAVPGKLMVERPVAWLDSQHVAVLSRIVIKHQESARLDVVDVRSGARRTLVRPATGEGARSPEGLSLATQLLTAPTTEASAPPHPWNLRWTLGLSGLGLVCLVLLVWGFRGRRA